MKHQLVIHQIEYMPSGEQFSEQRDNWATPYKFNGKELDQETGLYYYGARYYTPEIGIWLSVDPLSDKYPSLSPYAYCALNPVIFVDPDGREITDYRNLNGTLFSINDGKNDLKIVLTSSDRKSDMQATVDKGDVIDMPHKNVIKTFDKIYNETDQNNVEFYAAGSDNGTMSDIFKGTDGKVSSTTIKEAQDNLKTKGENTTWDVHSHNNNYDNGVLMTHGKPEASGLDKQTKNKMGVILGYGLKPIDTTKMGGGRETNRRIGFYNSKGQIGLTEGYSYEKFSKTVKQYGK